MKYASGSAFRRVLEERLRRHSLEKGVPLARLRKMAVAEKVHACTRPYPGGESSRVEDWVDILLLAQQGALHAVTLRRALEATFQTRATHPLPKTFPALSKTWEKTFRRLAQQTGMPIRSLEEAESALGKFLNRFCKTRLAVSGVRKRGIGNK